MADEKYTLETSVRVYDNRHGTYYQVAPDEDGLGLVTLSYCEPGVDSLSFPRFTFDAESLPAIVKALLRVAQYNGEKND